MAPHPLSSRSAEHLQARLPKMVVRMARQGGCNVQVLGICLLVAAVDNPPSMVDLEMMAVMGAVVKSGPVRVRVDE